MNTTMFMVGTKLDRGIRYVAPRVLGFTVWSLVMVTLFLVRVGQLCYESGKLFREQFDAGYFEVERLAAADVNGLVLALASHSYSLAEAHERVEDRKAELELKAQQATKKRRGRPKKVVA